MCFYENLDCDWTPEVFDEDKSKVDTKPVKCWECHREIPAGETHTWFYGQEYEMCVLCEENDPDCQHNFGDSYEYFCCQTCQKIIDAIAAVEKDEGCPSHVSRPLLGGLREVFIEHSDAEKYVKRALEMFPELKGHTWFDLVEG